LAIEVHALLDSMKLKRTSTDVVRFGNVAESSAGVILWIGVMPESLSGGDGIDVARKCRDLLEKDGVADVNVEIRESVVTRSVKLLEPTFSSDPTVDLRNLLLPRLVSPSIQSMPWLRAPAASLW
jgi:hypothetical protein